MLFNRGNPYGDGPPARLALDWDDFRCGVSPLNDAAIGRQADWTVLVYAAADNNLAAAIYDNVEGLKTVGSSAAVHVCALFDGPLLTDSFFARLNAGSPLADDIILRYGELRVNAPDELARAIRLSRFFPAQRQLIVLSGHGRGWRGALLDENLGVRYKRDGLIDLPGDAAACDMQLRTCQRATVARFEREPALPAAGPIDIIAVDACYMGSFEALPFLTSQAGIVVLSEDQMPQQGFAYDDVLRWLFSNPRASSHDVAAYLVAATKNFYDKPERRRTVTQIALASSGYPPLAHALGALLDMLDVDQDADFAAVNDAFDHAWRFEPTESIDLRGFVLKLGAHPRADVRAGVDAFVSAWNDMVMASAVQGSEDGTNGIAI